MSGFEKRYHFAQNFDFALVILEQSTVDGLSVALCCASMATPVAEICPLEVRKYARCDYEKTAIEILLPLRQVFRILSVLQQKNGGRTVVTALAQNSLSPPSFSRPLQPSGEIN